jgi:hypothetical protein
MKKIINHILTALAIGCAWQQVMAEPLPNWTATVSVKDENGQPVSDANVEISYRASSPSEQTEISDKISGVTDTYGTFIATHKYTSYSLNIRSAKSGYYPTSQTYELGFSYDPAKWNATVNLVLRPVGRPIPMYAKWVRQGPSVFNQPVGYDMMEGDWVAPYGKGRTTDIIFTQFRDQKSSQDYEYLLKVSFPNQGDGIQEFTVPAEQSGSSLKSSREAPENGYQPEINRANVSHPPETAKMDYNPKRNYFFRVRTVLDQHGNIKSAMYGKIYGDFMQFTYYLNPTPNDQNMEFDPSRNLLREQKVPVP